jgi:hypothetical protein
MPRRTNNAIVAGLQFETEVVRFSEVAIGNPEAWE